MERLYANTAENEINVQTVMAHPCANLEKTHTTQAAEQEEINDMMVFAHIVS